MGFVPVREIADLVTRIFCNHGMSYQNATIVAANCVEAECDGTPSHGLSRIAGYVSTLKSGWVNGAAVPQIATEDARSVVRVDAQNGFAQPALEAAKCVAISKARAFGVCAIAIRESHHFGPLWPDVEGFANASLVAITTVNARSRVVPWGGKRAVYGTNPMAFAAPRKGGIPMVFDQASSAMSFSEIQCARDEGRSIPDGVGINKDGEITRDPDEILDGGALLPFGNHKGSHLALMGEILAAALTGSAFSFQVDSTAYPGAATSRTGQFVLLIDPQKTGGSDFQERIDALVERLRESGQNRIPGERRHRNRRAAMNRGLLVSEERLDELRSYLD